MSHLIHLSMSYPCDSYQTITHWLAPDFKVLMDGSIDEWARLKKRCSEDQCMLGYQTEIGRVPFEFIAQMGLPVWFLQLQIIKISWEKITCWWNTFLTVVLRMQYNFKIIFLLWNVTGWKTQCINLQKCFCPVGNTSPPPCPSHQWELHQGRDHVFLSLHSPGVGQRLGLADAQQLFELNGAYNQCMGCLWLPILGFAMQQLWSITQCFFTFIKNSLCSSCCGSVG